MDIGLELLEQLLVGHPEALFFINDYKPKPLELHRFCENGMGADHNILGASRDRKSVV